MGFHVFLRLNFLIKFNNYGKIPLTNTQINNIVLFHDGG